MRNFGPRIVAALDCLALIVVDGADLSSFRVLILECLACYS